MSAFAHYELNTSNSKTAKEFYHSVLGWKPQDMPMPGGVYTMLQNASGPIAGLVQNPAEETPSQWVAYASVSSAEQTLTKATENGATVVLPVTEIPGMGKYAVFVDPQGATLGIWEAAEAPKPAKKAAKKKTAKKVARKATKKAAKKKTAKKAPKKSSRKAAKKKTAKKVARKATKKAPKKKTSKKSSRKAAKKKTAKKVARKATKKAPKKKTSKKKTSKVSSRKAAKKKTSRRK